MPLFKKKITVDVAADGYLEFLKILENTGALIKEVAQNCGISEEILKMNWLNLRIFGIDFATGLILNDPQLTHRVLDLFYSLVLREFSEEYPMFLKGQLSEYTVAIKTEHHLGINWMVGRTFAKLTEIYRGDIPEEHLGDDIQLIMFGSLQFASTVELISEFFKTFRIKH